jgi:hypothetical protein
MNTTNEVKKPSKKTDKWDIADTFMAVVCLGVLNATLVYSVLTVLQMNTKIELSISAALVLILNLHIAKRLFK